MLMMDFEYFVWNGNILSGLMIMKFDMISIHISLELDNISIKWLNCEFKKVIWGSSVSNELVWKIFGKNSADLINY